VAVEHGVTIIGYFNLASSTPYHASLMYARNLTAFLPHLLKDGKITLDMEDEITRETLVTRGGEVVHPRVRELLSLHPSDSRSPSHTGAT
jgi:NAD(P) transhydrogenase subunit alpha